MFSWAWRRFKETTYTSPTHVRDRLLCQLDAPSKVARYFSFAQPSPGKQYWGSTSNTSFELLKLIHGPRGYVTRVYFRGTIREESNVTQIHLLVRYGLTEILIQAFILLLFSAGAALILFFGTLDFHGIPVMTLCLGLNAVLIFGNRSLLKREGEALLKSLH